MYVSNRYCSNTAKWIDQLSHLMMDVWLTILSHFASCYILTISEKQNPQNKLIDYLICGPLYGIVAICLSPIGFAGICMWVLLCISVKQEKYTYASVDTNSKSFLIRSHLDMDIPNIFTIGTANILLAPEFVSRINNLRNTYSRCNKIAKKILNHSGKPICNITVKGSKYDIKKHQSLSTQFPHLDFLCFQEVWERSYALLLIYYLQEEFKYFLYDIGEYSLKINAFMMGSGLMFASKWPILDADFKAFTFSTKHAKYVSQGILCVKVLLGYGNSGERHIGYISNLHTQAFQGKDAVIASQLSEAHVFLAYFKKTKLEKNDVLDFDVLCGDFNADNMSPGDTDIQEHVLLSEYNDFCVERPGLDKDWTVGTEMRQTMMYDPQVSHPELFKEALLDDSLRRKFLLDADVIIHSHDLMTDVAQPGRNGCIEALPYGGKRRIDKVLVSETCDVEVIGYCFLTALASLTDHLPVCLTLRINQPAKSQVKDHSSQKQLNY